MESTIYLEVGQHWIRDDNDAPIRLIGTREHRWIVEDDNGDQGELAAGELRAQYRFASAN